MTRAQARMLVGLALFLGAAAVGFLLAPSLASESLRLEAEKRLTAVIGEPVAIRHVRVRIAWGVRLEGADLASWRDGAGEPALEVDRVRADVSLLSVLLGDPRFERILFDGARLRIARDRAGAWHPAPVAALLAPKAGASAAAPPHPDELLSPLIRLETAVRALLEKQPVADRLELRNGTIAFSDAHVGAGVAPPTFLALETVNSEYRRSRLSRASRLSVRAHLVDTRGDRGAVEWEGVRNRSGVVRVTTAMTGLKLDALAPYVRARHPEARVEGSLSGAVVFETASPGDGRIEVDLVAHDLRTSEPRSGASTIAARRVAAVGTLEITPQAVRLHGAHLRGGELELALEGTVARPLRSNSFAQISLEFRNVDVAEVRHLIGWLPEVEREEADEVVKVIEQGRLRSLRAGGAATISAWQAFLAGRTRTPPAEFVLDATLADTVVRVGENDRLEDLGGRLWWSGNHAEVRGVRATLNGSPLPLLDVAVDNVTYFLAGDPERRRLVSGGVPLPGMRTVWEWFEPDPGEPKRPDVRTAIGLEIQRLHHPLFLWPIENANAVIWDTEHGVHINTTGGTWAGVPVAGEADWIFSPEERVRIRLVASAPEPGGSVSSPERGWAEGRIVVGLRQDGPWMQQHAVGRFSAFGPTIRFEDIQIAVKPSGDLAGSVELTLDRHGFVPFEMNFVLEGGDVEALAEQFGQPPDLGTGRVNLAGSLSGTLRPRSDFFDGLSGLLEVEATDGVVRRSIPAIVAVALASESLNPFARRDQVRYERCKTLLEFDDGVMNTAGFSLDGPDVRVFAAGTLDVLRPPHTVDAQVALFLFRQIDRVLGKIPIVNLILLGTNENLIGAHFRLSGPWGDPQAAAVPLSALASGPASILEQGPTSIMLETLPLFMMKGIDAIKGMLGLRESPHDQVRTEEKAPGPSES